MGLLGFGVAVALMIQSRIGLGPWDAFHVGVHKRTGITVGTASILVGVVIVVGSLALQVRPGWGTLVNMVMIGAFIDLVLVWIPPAPNFAWGLTYYLPAIALCGYATGLYIAAGLGKGPRDGLMIGVSARTGWSISRVRTLLELGVLMLGWAMGGRVGVGTLLFAFGIGPATQWGLERFGIRRDVAAVAPAMEPTT